MIKLIIMFNILIFSSVASAQGIANAFGSALGAQEKKTTGVSFEFGLGYPDVKIDYNNADGSAVYSGFAFNTKSYIPIWFGTMGSLDFTLGGRFLSLRNTASSSTASEHQQQIGLSTGFRVKLFRLTLGLENNFMQAEHYWVGDNTDELNYSFDVLSTYVGLDFSITENLKLAVLYSQGTGDVPSANSGLGADSAYTDSIYWVNFVYTTGDSFTQLLTKAFK